jgi:hypothetical protein
MIDESFPIFICLNTFYEDLRVPESIVADFYSRIVKVSINIYDQAHILGLSSIGPAKLFRESSIVTLCQRVFEEVQFFHYVIIELKVNSRLIHNCSFVDILGYLRSVMNEEVPGRPLQARLTEKTRVPQESREVEAFCLTSGFVM